jgi:KipI family sensor histidine kinase inhibitor
MAPEADEGTPAVRTVRPFGRRGLMVDLEAPADVHRLRRVVEAAGRAVEVVPGWCTLLVRTDEDPGPLADWLRRVELAEGEQASDVEPVEIEVVYDGPDLEDVAKHVNRSADEVVKLHTRPEYTVVMLGFSRGFPYLAGMDETLAGLSRLATPRKKVPAGSVGIALDQTGIYPKTSPGGWRLLGRTDVTLFDPDRWPPSLLEPGGTVRFKAVG